jgi:cystathionine beta-lyase/cystathionine gamma-synthase
MRIAKNNQKRAILCSIRAKFELKKPEGDCVSFSAAFAAIHNLLDDVVKAHPLVCCFSCGFDFLRGLAARFGACQRH